MGLIASEIEFPTGVNISLPFADHMKKKLLMISKIVKSKTAHKQKKETWEQILDFEINKESRVWVKLEGDSEGGI